MANRYFPKAGSVTTVIPFDNPVTVMPAKTIIAPTTFTKTITDAQASYGAMIRITADGVNVPDFSAFKKIGSGSYVNTNGIINLCVFLYDGADCCVSFHQPTNISGGGGVSDTTPPTMVSATATDPTTVRVVFSESVTPTTAGWDIYKQDILETASVTSVSGSGTTWDFVIGGTAMDNTMTLKISYNATTGNTLDGAGNELATISLVSVTNSIPGIDTDVETWATASGIADATYKTHVSTFVQALKTAGIFSTHFDFLHILCGGDANKCKLNLINPTDSDAAYRLNFVNSATFAATGVTTNGTSQYIDSFFKPGSAGKMTANDSHVAVYHRTSAGVDGVAWGIIQAGNTNWFLVPKNSAGNTIARYTNMNQLTFAATTGKGFFLMNKATTAIKLWQDSTQIINEVDNGNSELLTTTYKLPFNARVWDGTIDNYRAAELSVISGGKSFDNTQRAAYQSAVAQLVTNLGL